MSNSPDSIAIREASTAVEELAGIISILKSVCTISTIRTTSDDRRQAVQKASQKAVSYIVRKLRKQLAIARQSYSGDTASSIRVVAYRRPVSARDLVLEAATMLDGAIHSLWPESQRSRATIPKQNLSKVFAAISRTLSRLDAISINELAADRDRAIANAVKQKPAVGTPRTDEPTDADLLVGRDVLAGMARNPTVESFRVAVRDKGWRGSNAKLGKLLSHLKANRLKK
jgi:hypothetical protein